MSDVFGLIYLVRLLMQSPDPVATLLSLNPLELLGLGALVATVVAVWMKRKSRK